VRGVIRFIPAGVGALPGREVLQGGDERQAYGVASDGDLGGIPAAGGQLAVGDGFEPWFPGGCAFSATGSRAVHRPGASLHAFEHVQARPAGDPRLYVLDRAMNRTPGKPVKHAGMTRIDRAQPNTSKKARNPERQGRFATVVVLGRIVGTPRK